MIIGFSRYALDISTRWTELKPSRAEVRMALTVLLLVVQMWLLSATLDAYLAGHSVAALPGAVISGVLFLACGGLHLFVNRLEKMRGAAGAADSRSSPQFANKGFNRASESRPGSLPFLIVTACRSLKE